MPPTLPTVVKLLLINKTNYSLTWNSVESLCRQSFAENFYRFPMQRCKPDAAELCACYTASHRNNEEKVEYVKKPDR